MTDPIQERDAALLLLEDTMSSTLDHAYPLRRDRTVHLRGVPRDLTIAEVQRLKGFLESLVIPEPATSKEPT